MKKLLVLVVLTLTLSFLMIYRSTAEGKSPGESTKIYVYLNFEGNPAFPSITSTRDTTGLARFTGLPFGITPFSAQRDTLVNMIIGRVREDFAAFSNIEFVTDTTGLEWWYTWGIDDSAFVTDLGAPPNYLPNPDILPINPYASCPQGALGPCIRIFGKEGGYADVNEIDWWGKHIFQPMYVRTFAGSYALGDDAASPSEIPLILGEPLTGTGKIIGLEELANALGNSASHEIGHLFGARHTLSTTSKTDIMYVETETKEAFYNKSFVNYGLDTLTSTLVTAVVADKFEPNNAPLLATPIYNGVYENLTLDNPFDDDFYSVVITEDNSGIDFSFTIDRSNYGGSITPSFQNWANVEITYRECDGCASAYKYPEVTETGYRFQEKSVPAGRIYEFHVYQAAPRQPMNYKMTVFAGKGDLPLDRREPNDSSDTASAISGCTANSEVNIHNASDVDYYKINANGYSVTTEIVFDPNIGNLELYLDDIQATNSILSQDGTSKSLYITGCGLSPSYIKVQGDRNFYKICTTKVPVQEGCPAYTPLVPLVGNGTFIFTGQQVGPGGPPPEQTAILRDQMQAHITSESSNTVLWSIGAYLDFTTGQYLPLVLEANCSKEVGAPPVDIVAKILSQNLSSIVWSGSGQGQCFGTESHGVITGISTVINMTSICGFGCAAPGHGVLTVNKSGEIPVAEAGGPYSGTPGAPVIFSADGSFDPNGTIVLYEWDWNSDGIYDDSTSIPGISHIWNTPYSGNVGLRVTDNDGFTAVDAAFVDIKPLSFKVSGGAYFSPEFPIYRASFSMDITGPASPSGWLKYSYARTRMNFASTGITSANRTNDSVIISGTGTVNGIAGYSFTANVVNGNPDTFSIIINRPNGSLFYSAGPMSVSGGDFLLTNM